MAKNITEYNRKCLEQGSYMLYNLADYENEGKSYPTLFNHDMLIADKELIKTIISQVPFYIHETIDDVPQTDEEIEDFLFLPDSRDSGINDVHSRLQENEFWSPWLRDAWGDEANRLLLDIYNKMRWSFMSENTYMNAISLLKDDGESNIEFDSSDESDAYMKEIVEAKLQNIYSLLNYNMNSSEYLNDWADSLVNSGKLTRQEADREILVYKLQDVRNEVIRRKLAGSSSLYRMLLNSIDRQGTFCGATRVGRVTGRESYSDPRLMRSIYAPWQIPFDSVTAEDYDENLKEMWHEKGGIPLGLFEPLFYTDDGTLRRSQGNNEFSVDEPQGSLEVSKVRKSYTLLRLDQILNSASNHRHSIVYLNPEEFLTIEAWNDTSAYATDGGFSFTLKELLIESYGLDPNISYDDACDTILHTIGEGQYNLGSSTEIIYTDATLDAYTTATIGDGHKVANMLDITANKVLYHDNSIFKEMGSQYPYPVVNGHPICLMDTTWIEHLKRLGEDKTRVSESVMYGVQVGEVLDLEDLDYYSFYWVDEDGHLVEERYSMVDDSFMKGITYGDSKTESSEQDSDSPYYNLDYNARCGAYKSLPLPSLADYTNVPYSATLDKNSDGKVDKDDYDIEYLRVVNENNRRMEALSEIKHKLALNHVTPVRVTNDTLTSSGEVAHRVTKVKAFARPLEESILLDPKGEFGTSTTAKAINQHLINGVEEFNGSPREDITVYDNGEETVVHENGVMSCATTTIYPVNYVEQPYSSDNSLTYLNGRISGTLGVPITPEEGSFTYSGDFGFNFEVDKDIDLASAYSQGDNVILEAYKDGNGSTIPMVRLKDTSLRDSASNFIDTVFTAPHGKSSGDAEVSYLVVKNARLNSALVSFLDARNYYEEILIPNDVYVGTSQQKTGRYDGIRTLREGEYYFTSKYPFKILPVTDVETDTDISGMNYANIYGTVRFKVVVKGEEFLGATRDIPSSAQEYRDSMVDMFLNSSQALQNPVDNMIFPHRKINIDLYVLTRASSEWRWLKVATNATPSDSNIIKLTATTLSEAITLKRGVPMFFSKSYISSFFTGDSRAPSFDEVRITIGDGEDIWADTSDDIGMFKLQSEKSYRLLFDYTANTTEISFFEGYHGSGDSMSVTQTELTDYAKMVRIDSSDVKESDYMYNQLSEGWMTSSASVLRGTCGYKVDADMSGSSPIYSWGNESNNFGDPYKKSASKNKLYQFDPDYSSVDNNYFIPYMYEFGRHQISCVPQRNGFFNEVSVLENHHKSKMRGVNSAISTLTSSTAGTISAMSCLEPMFTSSDILPTIITHEDYDYVTYTTNRRSIPTVTDGLIVESKELFGNNMIASKYFNDSKWSIVGTSVHWADDDTYTENKNVWEFDISPTGATLTYGENTYRNIVSDWEVSVCLKGSGITGVEAVFVSSDGSEARYNLSREKQLTLSWFVWSITVQKTSCTSLRFVVKGSGTARATKFVARRRSTISHPYGLGDCLRSTGATSVLSLPSHEMLMMRNRVDNWMTPLLVRSRVETIMGVGVPVSGTTRQFMLSDGCRINGNRLLKPWVGHITFSDKNGGKLYGYYVNNTAGGVSCKDTEYFGRSSFGHIRGQSTITFSTNVNNDDWAPVPTNFKVYAPTSRNDMVPSISLTNERFGGLSNSMDVDKLNKGMSSPVAITNVQLIEEGSEDNVLYEFEYLPIIYDEKDQHLSFNYVVVLDKGE